MCFCFFYSLVARETSAFSAEEANPIRFSHPLSIFFMPAPSLPPSSQSAADTVTSPTEESCYGN
jgi:hypothetical protein